MNQLIKVANSHFKYFQRLNFGDTFHLITKAINALLETADLFISCIWQALNRSLQSVKVDTITERTSAFVCICPQ